MTSFLTTIALANHQVGLIICRALQLLGPRSDEDLKLLLIPNYSVTPAMNVDQWNNTLEALRRTGLIDDVGSHLVLSDNLQNCAEISHAEFSLEFMHGLTRANLEAIENGEVPDDLFLGIVWLLTLPNGYLIRKFDPNNQQSDGPYRRLQTFGFKDAIVRVDQWRPFRRWARGLGLMRPLDGNTDSVDISDFVFSWLKNTEIGGPIDDFVAQLKAYLPMLNNDQLSSWYVNFTGNQNQFPQIDDQLAWALLRAEQVSLIRLENEDDTRVNTISLPVNIDGLGRLVTHIRKVA
jgi:hypothetical protein